jgi:hypothetical protein
MGGASSTHEVIRKQDLFRKPQSKRLLERPAVLDGKIILKLVLEKYGAWE